MSAEEMSVVPLGSGTVILTCSGKPNSSYKVPLHSMKWVQSMC